MTKAPLIHPVILCGGGGTRLWPLSRQAHPKPFIPLIGETTLFQQAIARVSNDERFAPPTVVAGDAHCDMIEEQLASGGYEVAQLIVEPCARNTAPAIALAAARLPSDAIMLVCPSDHHIGDNGAFREAASAAAALASENWLVSFGIAATHPETGYGYLRRGEALRGGYRIARFVEKPDLETAKGYLGTGEYSWNGGIFAFRSGALLAELGAHRPKMTQALAAAIAGGREHDGRFHPDAQAFAEIEGESIDYAVMENTKAAAMVSADMGWSDIGSWASLAQALSEPGDGSASDSSAGMSSAGMDANGNMTHAGTADLVSCSNVFAISDGPRISAIGLENVCIVVSGDEVLVTTHEGAQQVGKLPGATNQ